MRTLVRATSERGHGCSVPRWLVGALCGSLLTAACACGPSAPRNADPALTRSPASVGPCREDPGIYQYVIGFADSAHVYSEVIDDPALPEDKKFLALRLLQTQVKDMVSLLEIYRGDDIALPSQACRDMRDEIRRAEVIFHDPGSSMTSRHMALLGVYRHALFLDRVLTGAVDRARIQVEPTFSSGSSGTR